jgi:hypothetical protein
MSLVAKQHRFAMLVARLLLKAQEMGMTVTLGDAYRDPRVHGPVGVARAYGHARSCHKVRLAIDLNLFAPDGTYLEGADAHRALGEWWEAQGGTWGGRFKDPNHYSLAHEGMK